MNNHDLPPMSAPPPGRDQWGRTPRPPYDRTVELYTSRLPSDPLTPEQIVPNRARKWVTPEAVEQLFGVTPVVVACPGYGGAEISCTVYRRPDDDAVGPGFIWIHGGGMVGGEALYGILDTAPYLRRHGGTVVSIEYRLAPEHPAPIPVEDCYAALTWALDHAADLGFDPARAILGGGSAGGGLAAGTALLARDRGGPALLGAQLFCPMLDDRNDSLSIQQYDLSPGWSGQSNQVGWTALLGEKRGTSEVSPYDAPARASWLGGLPPVQITIGSADPFRSENVAFAEAIWRDGGDCELYVLPGGHHGYEGLGETSAIVRSCVAARAAFIDRLLQPDDLERVQERVDLLVAATTTEEKP